MTGQRLHGWARLWIVLCVLYGSLVTAITWIDFPTRAPPVSSDELERTLPASLVDKMVSTSPSIEELGAALVKADAAGNTVAATRLAAEIRRIRAGEARNPKRPIYFLRGPDGGVYSVEGSESGTEREMRQEINKYWKEKVWKTDPIVLEMADGLELTVAPDTPKAQLAEYGTTWKHLSDRKLAEWQRTSARNAFLIWAIPCLLVLIAGIAARWIYRGFRGQQGDAA